MKKIRGFRPAKVFARNGDRPWNKRPKISPIANWIWTSNYRGRNTDKVVYCQLNLRPRRRTPKGKRNTMPNILP